MLKVCRQTEVEEETFNGLMACLKLGIWIGSMTADRKVGFGNINREWKWNKYTIKQGNRNSKVKMEKYPKSFFSVPSLLSFKSNQFVCKDKPSQIDIESVANSTWQYLFLPISIPSHTIGKVKSSWKDPIFNSDRGRVLMWEGCGFIQWHLLAAVAGSSWLEPKALWSSYWFSWHQKLISFPNTLDHVQNHPTSHSPNQSFGRSMWNWNLLLTTNEPR